MKKQILKIDNPTSASSVSYKELAELLPQTVFEMNEAGILTFSNKNGLSMFGYSEDDFNSGLTALQMIVPYERELAAERIRLVLSGQKSGGTEYTGLRKDGSTFPILLNSSPIFKNRKIAGLRGIIVDISERKLAEAEIKESEDKFRKLAEKSLVGIYIIQDGIFTYINARLAEIFEYAVDDLINIKGPQDLTHPDDWTRTSELIKKLLTFEVDSLSNYFRGITKHGKLIDIETFGSYTSLKGKAAIIGSLLDITERKKTEAELKKLSRAVEQSPASIIITDINGNIEYVNPKFSQITGYSFEEVIGKNPSLLKSGAQSREFYGNLWTAITNGEEWHGELNNKKKNGEIFWEFASISPLKNSEGITTNFIAVKEDITERKAIEKELAEAKAKAEELNRIKSVFLANMSHELRTPLIGILGFAEILMDEIEKPEQKEMANTILVSGKRLLESVEMILSLSYIESGNIDYTMKPLNISEAMRNHSEHFASEAKKKNLFFSLEIKDPDTQSRIDEKLFAEIVKNLLSNAVKFTHQGGITVEISSETSSQNIFSVIKISDTGIGIINKTQEIIFEEFRQGSEGYNRHFEGTGLGLTLTKKYIQMMGGSIEVQSEVGKGSVFTVRFPSIKNYDSLKDIKLPPATVGEHKPKILSVENDIHATKIIHYFLRDICLIDHSETGEKAIKLAEKNHYSAILMDINLSPGISGLEAVKEIKKHEHNKEIPIVAVTAYSMPKDKEKFLREGCSHYLAKPFDRKTLIDLMNDILKS